MIRPFFIGRKAQNFCGLVIFFLAITTSVSQAQPLTAAKDYLKRANTNHEKGDLNQAIADYSRAIAINPFLAKAYAARGIAWFAKGNLEQAIADYSTALEIGLTPRPLITTAASLAKPWET